MTEESHASHPMRRHFSSLLINCVVCHVRNNGIILEIQCCLIETVQVHVRCALVCSSDHVHAWSSGANAEENASRGRDLKMQPVLRFCEMFLIFELLNQSNYTTSPFRAVEALCPLAGVITMFVSHWQSQGLCANTSVLREQTLNHRNLERTVSCN